MTVIHTACLLLQMVPNTLPKSPTWGKPPDTLALKTDEVHVWRADLGQKGFVQPLLSTLTADERARAARFYFEKDREHFIIARGVLRNILSRYLQIAPERIRFHYLSHGKPAVAWQNASVSGGGKMLSFNVSHSHGLALYAVTHGREVGIDVEYIRPNLDSLGIAERFFSSQEVADLLTLPTAHQHRAFFTCWTRKEAFVKAKGGGLSIPLGQFDVSLLPDQPAQLRETKWNPQEAKCWSLKELHPGEGYVGALVVESPPETFETWDLKCWQWD
jgi:4'-phosphopantetheinyl transferase